MKTQANSQHRWTETLFMLGVVAVITGAVITLIGAYWDDAWHTDIGRDTFWSPPHLALYGGVGLFSAGVALWVFLACAQERDIRTVWRQKPLLIALVGAAVTLLSAPIDHTWHVLFGRDAVLWSPPHTMTPGWPRKRPLSTRFSWSASFSSLPSLACHDPVYRSSWFRRCSSTWRRSGGGGSRFGRRRMPWPYLPCMRPITTLSSAVRSLAARTSC